MARNALGRGLGALIRDVEVETPQAAPAVATTATAAAVAPAMAVAGGPLLLDIDLLDPSPYQPRTRFSEAALEELAQSIRSSGIIQPLVVRRIGARYHLIAGERRWRAAQRAQLLRVPVVVREGVSWRIFRGRRNRRHLGADELRSRHHHPRLRPAERARV